MVALYIRNNEKTIIQKKQKNRKTDDQVPISKLTEFGTIISKKVIALISVVQNNRNSG